MEKNNVEIRMSDELLEKWIGAKRRIENIISDQDMGFITYSEMKEQINGVLKNL